MTTTAAELEHIENKIRQLTARRTELQTKLVSELESAGTPIRRPGMAGRNVVPGELVHILTQTAPDGIVREFAHAVEGCKCGWCRGPVGSTAHALGDTYRFDGTWKVVAADPDSGMRLICVPELSSPEWTLQAMERECERTGVDYWGALATLNPERV
jgi:hypothetical protein